MATCIAYHLAVLEDIKHIMYPLAKAGSTFTRFVLIHIAQGNINLLVGQGVSTATNDELISIQHRIKLIYSSMLIIICLGLK